VRGTLLPTEARLLLKHKRLLLRKLTIFESNPLQSHFAMFLKNNGILVAASAWFLVSVIGQQRHGRHRRAQRAIRPGSSVDNEVRLEPTILPNNFSGTSRSQSCCRLTLRWNASRTGTCKPKRHYLSALGRPACTGPPAGSEATSITGAPPLGPTADIMAPFLTPAPSAGTGSDTGGSKSGGEGKSKKKV
jgi:hypothetical protein